MTELLKLDALRVSFATPSGPAPALDGVSLELSQCEVLGLIGETGCGKSVLANAIIGLFPANARVSGAIYFQGRNILEMTDAQLAAVRGNEIGLIYQNPSLALNPVYTVGHQQAEVFQVKAGYPPGRARRETTQLLRRMRFQDPERVAGCYPFQLSGGMNQRVIIAMALALHPALLLADEPTKGLDRRLREEILQEFRAIKARRDTAMLLITHDFAAAVNLADRIALMYAGEIVEIRRTEIFLRRPGHPYAAAYQRSLPENGLHAITGAAPALTDLPPGCRFAARCPQRRDYCSAERPGLYPVDGGYVRCFQFR
jgi:peptide/nickel transport system ATP-binding protein